jgi:hypothetical protein
MAKPRTNGTMSLPLTTRALRPRISSCGLFQDRHGRTKWRPPPRWRRRVTGLTQRKANGPSATPAGFPPNGGT